LRRALRAEEELALRAAATSERRRAAAPRLRALLDVVDWDALLADLEYQRMLPLLGGRILEIATDRAPPAFAAAVHQRTAAARDVGALLELTTLRVATALEAADVPNVPLKGPVLARALHGDPGMRHSRDIDVLVARADLGGAADAVAELGWRRKDDHVAEPVLHTTLVHDAGLPDVELHWRVHWYEAEFGARALERAMPAPDGVRRLRPLDELAVLMLVQARDGFAGLRHPTDIAAWWDAHGAAAGPPTLEPILEAHPALYRALTASAALLEMVVGIPAARLVRMPSHLPWGLRRAIAMANPLMRGEPQQVTAEVSLVDGLLSPKGERLAFVRRRVLADARDLPAGAAARPLTLARAEHVVRVLRRYALAVARPSPRLTRADEP
jgi:hypothetical protein